MRLSVKLALGFFPMMLLWAAALYRWTGKTTQNILFDEAEAKAFLLAQSLVLDENFIDNFRQSREAQMLRPAMDAKRSQNALYVFVLDPGNKIIAHTDVSPVGHVYPRTWLKEFKRHRGYASRRTGPAGHVIEVLVPIWAPKNGKEEEEEEEEFLLTGEEQNLLFGRVGVGYSLEPSLITARRISRIIFAIVIISSAALALLAAIFLRSFVVQPVRSLALAAHHLGEGHLGATIPVSSQDELGDLTASFNRMSLDLARTTVSQNFLDNVLSNMSDALLVTSADGRIKMANEKALQWSGYAASELTGFPATMLLAKDLGPKTGLEGPRHEFFSTTTAGHWDCNLLTKEGRLIPALVSSSRFQDGDQEGFIVTIKDMTEPRRLARARESVSLAARLIVNADDLGKIYEELPKLLCERFGWSMAFIELYEPAAKKFILAATHGIKTYSASLNEAPALNEKEWTLATATDPSLFEKAAFARFGKACAPVREREVKAFMCVPIKSGINMIGALAMADPEKKSEAGPHEAAALRQIADLLAQTILRRQAEAISARLAAFPEENPNPIIEFNKDLTITYLNTAARQQFPDLMDQGKDHAISVDLKDDVEQLRRDQKKSLVREIALEGFVYERDAVMAPGGLVRLYITDITQRKNFQEMALQSEKMAAMGQLAAGVAHEINNPLGGALGMTDILLEELPAETGMRPDLEVIKRSLIRCRDIVTNLLGFSRKYEFQLKPDIVQDLIDDTLKLCHEQLFLSGVRVAKNYGSKRLAVNASPAQLQQVFLNLLLNARDAMPGGGQLTITLEEQPKGWARTIFQDTGDGIDPEILKRIFEPFFTTKEKGKGTGLGLALSFDIVSRHRGYLEARSEGKGRGAQMIVNLPLREDRDHGSK
ncbi:MAG: PAS domain S-box protein [Elusimicrobia bacterium]|nr:PAS domain S-box protein [Elusimicrobiota bacterium]